MSASDPFALARGSDDCCDHEAAAAIEFEPIEKAKEFQRSLDAAPWAKRTASIGVNLRIASIMVGKTKEEMVEAFRALGDDMGFEIFEALDGTAKELQALAALATAASIRMIIAASVIAVGEPNCDAPGELPRGSIS